MAVSNFAGLVPAEGSEEGFVSLSSLSDLTGFPEEFVKRELLIEDEKVTIEELRQMTINYLNHLSEKFKSV